MRATGIVRRIDDLGRVVVPKELRRTLRIKEGDPLEIFVDSGEIILKKYQPFTSIEDYAQDITETLYDVFTNPIMIADERQIIAVAGEKKKEYLKKDMEDLFPKFNQQQEIIYEKAQTSLEVNGAEVEMKGYLYMPIEEERRLVGSIIMLGTKQAIDDTTWKSMLIQKKMLERHLSS